MTKTTTNEARLFVTDYASYNEGKQFEHGHWVDLSDFSDADEFNDYLENHFKNVVGLDDYEPMYTDFEGFDKSLYSESMSTYEIENIFKYIELDFENKSDGEKISLWNEYCSENYIEDEIYNFDDDFFETFFAGEPEKCARAVFFGNIQNWGDEYIKFDGYANLESLSNHQAVNSIDEKVLIEWLIDNL